MYSQNIFNQASVFLTNPVNSADPLYIMKMRQFFRRFQFLYEEHDFLEQELLNELRKRNIVFPLLFIESLKAKKDENERKQIFAYIERTSPDVFDEMKKEQEMLKQEAYLHIQQHTNYQQIQEKMLANIEMDFSLYLEKEGMEGTDVDIISLFQDKPILDAGLIYQFIKFSSKYELSMMQSFLITYSKLVLVDTEDEELIKEGRCDFFVKLQAQMRNYGLSNGINGNEIEKTIQDVMSIYLSIPQNLTISEIKSQIVSYQTCALNSGKEILNQQINQILNSLSQEEDITREELISTFLFLKALNRKDEVYETEIKVINKKQLIANVENDQIKEQLSHYTSTMKQIKWRQIRQHFIQTKQEAKRFEPSIKKKITPQDYLVAKELTETNARELKRIVKRNKELKASILSKTIELKTVPFYRIFFKRRIRNEIEESRKELSGSTILERGIKQKQTALEAYSQKVSYITRKIEAIVPELSSQIISQIPKYEEQKQLFIHQKTLLFEYSNEIIEQSTRFFVTTNDAFLRLKEHVTTRSSYHDGVLDLSNLESVETYPLYLKYCMERSLHKTRIVSEKMKYLELKIQQKDEDPTVLKLNKTLLSQTQQEYYRCVCSYHDDAKQYYSFLETSVDCKILYASSEELPLLLQEKEQVTRKLQENETTRPRITPPKETTLSISLEKQIEEKIEIVENLLPFYSLKEKPVPQLHPSIREIKQELSDRKETIKESLFPVFITNPTLSEVSRSREMTMLF